MKISILIGLFSLFLLATGSTVFLLFFVNIAKRTKIFFTTEGFTIFEDKESTPYSYQKLKNINYIFKDKIKTILIRYTNGTKTFKFQHI
jgi:hypothetical protein